MIILYQKLDNGSFNVLVKLLTIPKIILGRFKYFLIKLLFIIPSHYSIPDVCDLQNLLNQVYFGDQLIEVIIFKLLKTNKILLFRNMRLD